MALGGTIVKIAQLRRMTDEEYRNAIAMLGLSQTEAARLLGVDERTSRRWVSGEREIPPPAARFLRFLLATGITGARAIEILEH
jgi:DNA-binding transcriptional regulator YiaG